MGPNILFYFCSQKLSFLKSYIVQNYIIVCQLFINMKVSIRRYYSKFY